MTTLYVAVIANYSVSVTHDQLILLSYLKYQTITTMTTVIKRTPAITANTMGSKSIPTENKD